MKRNESDRSHESYRSSTEGLAHNPFKVLKGAKEVARLVRGTPAPKPAPPPSPCDDDSLFERAVAGVRPLAADDRDRVAGPPPAAEGRAVTSPDAEALAELCDLVNGNAPFDVTSSDEHVEGCAVGTDPRLLRRLRAGEFAYQGHIDLHGLTVKEAREAVEVFVQEAYLGGRRCVLIVHGRGRNSKDQIPVLKQDLVGWLARGQRTRHVLAFTSARACDGGVGALYVLLRRRRDVRRPIRVTTGAKW